jgi:hypothetical protein
MSAGAPWSGFPDLGARWGSGFLLDAPRFRPMLGPRSFGNDGAGGQFAFGDDEFGVGFGRRNARPAWIECSGGSRYDRSGHAWLGGLLSGVVSNRVFTSLDDYMWRLTYKCAKYRHSNKSEFWIVDRYDGRFNSARPVKWVFGDRTSGGYLPKFAENRPTLHGAWNGVPG